MKLIKKELSLAELERGEGLLKSLQIIINVIYGLLMFQLFLILPRPDEVTASCIPILDFFASHPMQLMVIGVGLVLIMVYWAQFNYLLGNLKRSSPLHALLALFQVFCLIIYLYFLRFDLELDGVKFALQMESVFLALAGFIGALNWRYARLRGLTSSQINKEELDVFYKILPEPLVSLFTLPFAVLGPNVWGLAL